MITEKLHYINMKRYTTRDRQNKQLSINPCSPYPNVLSILSTLATAHSSAVVVTERLCR